MERRLASFFRSQYIPGTPLAFFCGEAYSVEFLELLTGAGFACLRLDDEESAGQYVSVERGRCVRRLLTAYWNLILPVLQAGRFVVVGAKASKLLDFISAGCFRVPREHCIAHPATWQLCGAPSTLLGDSEVLDQKKYNADAATLAQAKLERLGVRLPASSLAAAASAVSAGNKTRGFLAPGEWNAGPELAVEKPTKRFRMTPLEPIPPLEPFVRQVPELVESVSAASGTRSFADVLRELESYDL